MSNDEYENVKALVRGLHAPNRNVSRPVSPSAPTTPTHQSNVADIGRLPSHNDFLQSFKTDRNSHHHSDNSLNLTQNVPALIVTDADQENLQHDQHGQRRFSQFYLGLRRFSNSYTVFSMNGVRALKL